MRGFGARSFLFCAPIERLNPAERGKRCVAARDNPWEHGTLRDPWPHISALNRVVVESAFFLGDVSGAVNEHLVRTGPRVAEAVESQHQGDHEPGHKAPAAGHSSPSPRRICEWRNS